MPKKNVPDVRFPGFEDDWKRRKFGDEMYIKSRVGWQALTKKEYLYQGDYYLITGTDIDEITHTVDLTKSWYVSKDRYDMDENIQVHNGDLIITKDGTIGKVAFVKDLDKPATLNSHLFLVRDLSGTLDSGFLFQILNSWVFQSFIERVKTGSTLTGLPQKTIVEFEFSYPSLEEQRQVSNFLETIDQTIIFHQRKLKEIKKLKNGLLQKMFPQKGDRVPQIRFPGFNDDWEQRKLKDLFKRVNERNDGTFGKDRWISVAKMYFQDPEKVQSNNIDTRTYVMRLGDIAFEGHPNADFKYGRFVVNDIGDGVVSELFPIYRHIGTYDNDYWKYAIQLESVMAPIFAKSITSSGNSSNKLDAKHFLRQSILVPSIEEQAAIGSFFSQLDQTITLHQKKIDDLNRLKSGLLQKMFI